jgi:hypothetical protein
MIVAAGNGIGMLSDNASPLPMTLDCNSSRACTSQRSYLQTRSLEICTKRTLVENCPSLSVFVLRPSAARTTPWQRQLCWPPRDLSAVQRWMRLASATGGVVCSRAVGQASCFSDLQLISKVGVLAIPLGQSAASDIDEPESVSNSPRFAFIHSSILECA